MATAFFHPPVSERELQQLSAERLVELPFNPATVGPDGAFHLDRENALIVIGTRAAILDDFRRAGLTLVKVEYGTLRLDLKKGSSAKQDLRKAARTTAGAALGTFSWATTAPRMLASRVANATSTLAKGAVGSIKHGENMMDIAFSGARSHLIDEGGSRPLTQSTSAIKREINAWQMGLDRSEPWSILQVSCGASNSFAASSRNPNGNSSPTCDVIADMLVRQFGF